MFIVVTFGDNQKNYGAAVIGAAAAIIRVTIVGIAVRAPLTKVPENWMKLVVGVMLTSFGTFWGAEGAGVRWPGNDAALLVLIPVSRRRRRLHRLAELAQVGPHRVRAAIGGRRLMKQLKSFGAFWYDFIVGATGTSPPWSWPASR